MLEQIIEKIRINEELKLRKTILTKIKNFKPKTKTFSEVKEYVYNNVDAWLSKGLKTVKITDKITMYSNEFYYVLFETEDSSNWCRIYFSDTGIIFFEGHPIDGPSRGWSLKRKFLKLFIDDLINFTKKVFGYELQNVDRFISKMSFPNSDELKTLKKIANDEKKKINKVMKVLDELDDFYRENDYYYKKYLNESYINSNIYYHRNNFINSLKKDNFYSKIEGTFLN